MVTGSSSVEALIPGRPEAIVAVLENVGSGAAPAQQVAHAWQSMQLPSWQGSAGDAWRAFTPKEHGRLALAPAAFQRAAAAMLRYEGAFRTARAEAQAAIIDAAAAEQATANAKLAHQNALRKAQIAPEDSPHRYVAPFIDPGSTALANAQSRVATAQRTLQAVGDEVAAEIRSAARTVSGASPQLSTGSTTIQKAGYTGPPLIGVDPNNAREFGLGVWDAIWATVVGTKDLVMLLGGDTAAALFTGGLPAVQEKGAREDLVRFAFIMLMMQGQWDEIGKIIGNAAGAIGGDMIGLEHWQNGNPARGAGRVVGEIGLLVAAFAKIGKVGALGKAGKGINETSAPKVMPPKPLSIQDLNSRIEGLRLGSTLVKENRRSGTTQLERSGGYDQALKDFEDLTVGLEVRVDDKGVKFAVLPDGRNINVREFSTRGYPTLELFDGSQTPQSRTKFRYKE